jgi:hypothetical protein
LAGGPTVSVSRWKATIDRLADHRRDRYAAFLGDGEKPLVPFVVEQYLKAVIERHTHTVACV